MLQLPDNSLEIPETINAISSQVSDKSQISNDNDEYGYPVNLEIIAKPKNRGQRHWTLLNEWIICTEKETAEYQLKGNDVIWGLVNRKVFNQALAEFKSGKFKNAKGKPTDSKGRRSIDNSMIEYVQHVLIDLDETTYNNTPEHIKNNAFFMCPSASQLGVNPSGDVEKMHYVHKLPSRIDAQYGAIYRDLYLKEICGNIVYDTSCTDPRREFFGKNPDFKDDSFYKVTLEKSIDIKLHTRLLLQAIDKYKIDSTENRQIIDNVEAPKKRGRPTKEKKDISGQIDEYLLAECNLEVIAKTLFPEQSWGHKGESAHCYDQWETNNFLNNGETTTAFAIQHSKKSERILIHYKGGGYDSSLYELYVRYTLWLDGNPQAYTMNIDNLIKGKKYVDVVEKICDKLDIEKFEFPKNDAFYTDILDGYVYCYSDETDKTIYYYWYFAEKIWQHTIGKNAVIARCIEPLLEMSTNLSEDEILKKASELVISIAKKSKFDISKPMTADADLIGFQDCIFNIKTKEKVEISHKYKIFSKLDFNYEIVDTSCIERISKFFDVWIPGDTGLLLDYFYASFLKLGQNWSSGMILYGASNSGKSTIFKSFAHIDKSLSMSVKEPDIMNNSYPYSQYHQGIHAIYVDDVRDINSTGMSSLLELLTENSFIPFTKKYTNSINFPRTCTIGFSSEDLPVKTHNPKIGMIRRILAIQVNHGKEKMNKTLIPGTTNSLNQELLAIFNNESEMRKFFMWSITNINPEEVIKRHKEYLNDDNRQDKLKTEVSEDSTITGFVDEFCEVAENENDYINREQLIENLKLYVQNKNDRYLMKLTDIQLLKHFHKDLKSCHIKGLKYDQIKRDKIDNNGKPIRKRIEGQLISVVWGIKWLNGTTPKNHNNF